MNESFSVRLKTAMDMRNMTASELCEKTGVPKSAISQYLSGAFKPKQTRTFILAQALRVDAAWLMGYDVPMEQRDSEFDTLALDNIFSIETSRIPFLGEIACGEPIYTNEDRESYVISGVGIKADFCLRAKGDSMKNARILDGDIVFIRKQDMVDNGDIAAVIIGDEATLKRVYYYRDKNILILKPDNPAYEDMIFSNEELNAIRILGKAIAIQIDAI